MPKIELIAGTKLKMVSHANILVSYEILEVPEVLEIIESESGAQAKSQAESAGTEKEK